MIIIEKTAQHLLISFTALFIALCIALPLGLSLSRAKNRKATVLVVRAISLIQTIPGLAMIAVIVLTLVSVRNFLPIPTTGFLPGVIALSLYAISPILTNTYTGIATVNPAMIDVATGLGMTQRQILFQVQAPHAIPMMMAGVRIAGVWTIGMCTLVSLVGSGGLGDLIFQGIRGMNTKLVLSGTIPAIFLAVFFEIGMTLLEKWLTVRSK